MSRLNDLIRSTLTKGYGFDPPGVVYSGVYRPIIGETDSFYYLGGYYLYIILKSKCMTMVDEYGDRYYEAVPSEDDIRIGKSPIVPIGCVNHRGKVYRKDLEYLESSVL